MSLGPEAGNRVDIREGREVPGVIPTKAITTALTKVVQSGKEKEVVAAVRQNVPEAAGDIKNLEATLGDLMKKLREFISNFFSGAKTTDTADTNGTNPPPNTPNTPGTPNTSGADPAREPTAAEREAAAEALRSLGPIESVYGDSHAEGLTGGTSARVKRGAQSSYGLAQLEADKQAGRVPKTIGWSFGANDIMSGNSGAALTNAEAAIKIAETAGSKFTLIAVPPMSKNGKQGEVDALNAQYKALAARYPHVTFVNPYIGMRNRSDGVHLAMSDYAAAAKALGLQA